jgi:hypothetical protein
VLIDDLERERRLVEDAAAAKLFAEATGFAPGRVECDTLPGCFDHGLDRGPARLGRRAPAEWARTVRDGWQATWRDEVCLPQILGNLPLDPQADPDRRTSSRLAVAYQPEGRASALASGPRPWREVGAARGLRRARRAFGGERPRRGARAGRPRSRSSSPSCAPTSTTAASCRPARAPRPSSRVSARRPRGAAAIRPTRCSPLAKELDEIWDLRFQETLRQALDEVRRSAARDELGPTGGLTWRPTRATARPSAEYFLMDFGSRPRPILERRAQLRRGRALTR